MNLVENVEQYYSQFYASLKTFSGVIIHITCYQLPPLFPWTSLSLNTFSKLQIFFSSSPHLELSSFQEPRFVLLVVHRAG